MYMRITDYRRCSCCNEHILLSQQTFLRRAAFRVPPYNYYLLHLQKICMYVYMHVCNECMYYCDDYHYECSHSGQPDSRDTYIRRNNADAQT